MSSFAQIERDRELWNPAIHWLLNVSGEELGAKGNLGGVVHQIEKGCAGGDPNTDPYSNYQMGWCAGDSPGDKWRKWSPVWFLLPLPTQAVLCAHYSLRNDLPPNQRVAVDGALGKLATAALWVHEGEKLARLIEACVDKKYEGRDKLIANATKKTESEVRAAHRLWSDTARSRGEWVLGEWSGYPLARHCWCPQCGAAIGQLAANWARGVRLPEECPACLTELRTPREPERSKIADAPSCCAETPKHSEPPPAPETVNAA
jgi:hypothetical protein